MLKTRLTDPNTLFTTTEVARLVNTSVSTVRRWVRTGRLRSQKVGRLHVVRPADLEEMFAQEDEELSPEALAYWEQRFPVLSEDDPYLQLSGIGDSGLTDVSEHHDRYVYRKDWEER